MPEFQVNKGKTCKSQLGRKRKSDTSLYAVSQATKHGGISLIVTVFKDHGALVKLNISSFYINLIMSWAYLSFPIAIAARGFKVLYFYCLSVQFSSVAQSCPTLCEPMNRSTPGPLSITNSRSSLRLRSIESVMPSSHLILCHPLLPPAPNPSQHQSLFQ